MRSSQTAIFRKDDEVYHADTCEPLRAATEHGEVTLVARARGAYPGVQLPAKCLTEVRTVGYWDADHNQSWGLDWHRNEGIELTYVSRGKLHFGVDAQKFVLKHGDLTITRPWQLHRLGSPHVTANRLYWLILDVGVRRPNQLWQWPKWLVSSPSDIDILTTLLRQNEHAVWQANDEIEYYFGCMGQTVESFDETTGESRLRLYISGLLLAVTDLLRRHEPTLDASLTSTQRAVELFLSTLVERLDQPWDVASMADSCGLGRSRFAHYCKRITNMSPVEYLTACRLEAATHLLGRQPELSITDVALQCGFGSSQYFATVFGMHHGCSPREFRRDVMEPQKVTKRIGGQCS